MACDRTPGSILLVDDEGSFRDSLAEMLRDDGHEVLAYPEPDALPPLDTLSGVDLLLTDYDMPKTNGLTLADRFHAVHPTVPVLLATAYRTGLGDEVARRPFVRMVQKPIPYETLHRLIHECATTPANEA
jgi:DNA-binding NtrC family response regulator